MGSGLIGFGFGFFGGGGGGLVWWKAHEMVEMGEGKKDVPMLARSIKQKR